MKRNRRHDSVPDKSHRYRGVVSVILIPLFLLISLVIFLMPPHEDYKYAVIFDTDDSSSRVHVFCFDKYLDLVPIGNDLQLFLELKPGLGASRGKDPEAAAHTLQPLVEKSEAIVPPGLRHRTGIRLGFTQPMTGFGPLKVDICEELLQAVREYLKDNSNLKSKSDWVTDLRPSDQGVYQWVNMNYLLGFLGKTYSDTVGLVDLIDQSVRIVYAISDKDAAKAPKITGGQDSYVKEMYLNGTKYYLYVHSYLHYGLLAARSEIFKPTEDFGTPCIVHGYGGWIYRSKIASCKSSSHGFLQRC